MKKYKYSCVSRLFDTVRCNFVRLNKNFPFLSHQISIQQRVAKTESTESSNSFYSRLNGP